MLYPTLNSQNSTRSVISAFGGYHHRLRISEGEFYDMENLTSAQYPLLCSRPVRGVYASPNDPQGLIAKDALCYVDGDTLYINGDQVEGLVLDTTEAYQPKTLVSMGAYLLIFPDRVYVNREDFSHGSIDAECVLTGNVTVTLCNIDGEEYKINHYSETQPEDETSGALWLDTSQTPNVLSQYSTTSGWVTVPTTYLKLSAEGIGNPFSSYDGVSIRGVESDALSTLNASHVIWAREEPESEEESSNYIVVVGMLDGGEETTLTASEENPIVIERRMPLFDYVTEAGNRLWACRYGVARNGEIVNEIYASKLGDFKNWNCFMGLSTDSYAASLGSDGVFTGAVTHLGYPIFFKEHCLHKIYGEIPSNFQIQSTACRGVQKGSAGSLAIVNGILYYKGLSSVLAYDGSLPQELNDVFGEICYHGAVGCAHGNRYYLSMKDASETPHLFVYDTAKGLWHREDSTEVLAFCSVDNELYFIDAADKKIKTVGGSGAESAERAVSWAAETGVMEADSVGHKVLSRLVLRLLPEIGTRIHIWVEYDSSGSWEHVGTVTGRNLSSYPFSLRPRRCDHLRLKLTGKGGVKLFSITKTTEEGSDRRW